MRFACFVIALFLASTACPGAPASAGGTVTGSVVEKASQKPLEFVAVTLRMKESGDALRQAATDAKGAFEFEDVPAGDYLLTYGSIGADTLISPAFSVSQQHASVNLGPLELPELAVKLDKIEVSATKEAFYNSVDRKVYNVGKDIQSATGSASDLLQNIPSIQVDIDGNVSLRGNESVLILVNGRSSAMMGKNRAAVLEQMPADSIEKIEVITNPSAKYKPDGTAGIINISLKKKGSKEIAGSVRASVGADSRYNAGVTASTTQGKFTFFGSANLRHDVRERYSIDTRTHADAATGKLITTEQKTNEKARPLSKIAQLGIDYRVDEANKFGATFNYNRRTFERHATEHSLTRDDKDAVTGDSDRLRFDPEFEQNIEGTVTFQHSFEGEGHELNVELKHENSDEQENNRYTNVFRLPIQPVSYDNVLLRTPAKRTELVAEYAYPMANESKLEAGYDLERDQNDMDFRGSFLSPTTGTWLTDTTRTNRFLYNDTIHAFYFTYAKSLGAFGALAGLRMEKVNMDMNQVTTGIMDRNDYFHLYPSLHLSYKLTEAGQLQLNYSHRVRRPESEDLNPFPEYQDPFNLRAGNPHLLPEETHSIEAGYQYKKDDTTYLATLYYRYSYNNFTTVTRYIDASTLLTTYQNLSQSDSGGLELAVTKSAGKRLSFNASSNLYRNQIDASNLGFSSSKSTVAWNAKFNSNFQATKTDLLQFNLNYTAKRLTPQGYRLPSFVSNLGYRHNFKDKKTALIFTVSDLFNSLKERTHIDTPILKEDISRKRSPRIVYIGFLYTFGKPAKKTKDDSLQYDNQL